MGTVRIRKNIDDLAALVADSAGPERTSKIFEHDRNNQAKQGGSVAVGRITWRCSDRRP